MKKWIVTNKLYFIGAIICGIAGFLYWRFVGCVTGSCPITFPKTDAYTLLDVETAGSFNAMVSIKRFDNFECKGADRLNVKKEGCRDNDRWLVFSVIAGKGRLSCQYLQVLAVKTSGL